MAILNRNKGNRQGGLEGKVKRSKPPGTGWNNIVQRGRLLLLLTLPALIGGPFVCAGRNLLDLARDENPTSEEYSTDQNSQIYVDAISKNIECGDQQKATIDILAESGERYTITTNPGFCDIYQTEIARANLDDHNVLWFDNLQATRVETLDWVATPCEDAVADPKCADAAPIQAVYKFNEVKNLSVGHLKTYNIKEAIAKSSKYVITIGDGKKIKLPKSDLTTEQTTAFSKHIETMADMRGPLTPIMNCVVNNEQEVVFVNYIGSRLTEGAEITAIDDNGNYEVTIASPVPKDNPVVFVDDPTIDPTTEQTTPPPEKGAKENKQVLRFSLIEGLDPGLIELFNGGLKRDYCDLTLDMVLEGSTPGNGQETFLGEVVNVGALYKNISGSISSVDKKEDGAYVKVTLKSKYDVHVGQGTAGQDLYLYMPNSFLTKQRLDKDKTPYTIEGKLAGDVQNLSFNSLTFSSDNYEGTVISDGSMVNAYTTYAMEFGKAKVSSGSSNRGSSNNTGNTAPPKNRGNGGGKKRR